MHVAQLVTRILCTLAQRLPCPDSILDVDSRFFALQLHRPAISLASYPAAVCWFLPFVFALYLRLIHLSLRLYTAGYTSFLCLYLLDNIRLP